jgi:polyvinyl alcohol dehydrogenase (cytochrome)
MAVNIGHRSLFLIVFTAGVGACGGDATPVATPTPAPTSADWPMYGHDARRTNYNKGDTSIGLGSVANLAPRFQTFIGMGDLPSSSSPIVSGGRVYLGSSVNSGENYFCLDAGTGAVLWSADIGHASFPGNVGIGSTGAVVDGVVYVGGGDAAYYALDAQTGAILWRHPMNAAPDAFAWSSPLVAGGVVYVGMSAQYVALRSELRALGAATGAVRASRFLVPEGHIGGDLWNSQALSPDGGRVVAATGNDYTSDDPYTRSIIAFDAGSLDILDSHQEAVKGQDLDFGTTPIVFHDASGRTLVGANQKNGRFYAYDLGALRSGPIWQRATGLSVGTMPAYDEDIGPGGTLFIMGDNGVLFGVDPATGADRWPPVAVGFSNSNVAAANGLVYLGGGTGYVRIVAADSGTLLKLLSPQTPARTFAGVAVSGGTIYAVAGPYLNAWSASSTGPAPGPDTAPKAHLVLTLVPDPEVAGPGTTAPHSARWRVALAESAGVGGTVESLNTTMRDASSGALAEPTTSLALTGSDVRARAGTDRIPPSGNLSFDMAVDYRLVSGGQAVTLTAAARFSDDNGHVVTAMSQARIR